MGIGGKRQVALKHRLSRQVEQLVTVHSLPVLATGREYAAGWRRVRAACVFISP